jgi:hypothetical protein
VTHGDSVGRNVFRLARAWRLPLVVTSAIRTSEFGRAVLGNTGVKSNDLAGIKDRALMYTGTDKQGKERDGRERHVGYKCCMVD